MSSCTDVCRGVILDRLVPNSKAPLRFGDELTEHKNYVFSLLKSTVLTGENNSALIVGPRGSGKTAVSSSTTIGFSSKLHPSNTHEDPLRHTILRGGKPEAMKDDILMGSFESSMISKTICISFYSSKLINPFLSSSSRVSSEIWSGYLSFPRTEWWCGSTAFSRLMTAWPSRRSPASSSLRRRQPKGHLDPFQV